MFMHKKIKKMFEDDDPKLVFYLDTKNIELEDVFKDDEDLIEKSIKNQKNIIAEAAITYSPNLNRVNRFGQTYLMIAIKYDNYSMFKKLLESDIKLDTSDVNRETALFYAIENVNGDFFDLLVSKDVDVKAYNNKGENTTIFAYKKGRKELVQYLIRNKVYINHLDKDGNTILHLAVIKSDLEFALKLIDLGADIFIKNYRHQTCLDIAKELHIEDLLISKLCEIIGKLFEIENEVRLIELLEEYAEVEDYSHFNIPFLIAYGSIKYQSDPIFDMIIRNERMLNSLDYRGKSLLMYCVEMGQFLYAQKILILGCDLNLCDPDNKTILFIVLEQLNNDNIIDHIKAEFNTIFNELLDYHVDVNIQDIFGNTLLMNAIINKQTAIVDKLINYQYTDLNIVNKEGKTALMLSYENNDLDTLYKVISSGRAELNTVDQDKNTLLLHALRDDNLELFTLLLNNGADLNIKYTEGMSILMIALNLHKIKFVAKIFDSNFDKFEVDLADDNGLTALMHAIQIKNITVVEALLRCGANSKLSDKYGKATIFYALDNNELEIGKLIRKFEQNNEVKK
ncbi:MAG: serine/threonine-protein phosphatase 6 regulatory ankyrin repeat subunit B-like [Haloplasmataceae bacterium]|jgi:ankyrin repeat protein|nr:serine/threonine-protein phosphatase 6 regulatory ankyrin repeat subunit B-like [Haloplasmataceae bacterium]